MKRKYIPFHHILEEIGNTLSSLRVKKGYDTVKSFAQTYKLPPIQYWRIEKGKANITLRSLQRLVAIHGLGLEDFFCMLKDHLHPTKHR